MPASIHPCALTYAGFCSINTKPLRMKSLPSFSLCHQPAAVLPSLSSSMWLMRRAMAAFSSLALSLALMASATISCHSSTWLCVSSALPDSLAYGTETGHIYRSENSKQSFQEFMTQTEEQLTLFIKSLSVLSNTATIYTHHEFHIIGVPHEKIQKHTSV